MPEMGESVTEGTVLEWHVAEGQSVAEGDTVIEVSTDKIDAEVPAPASGMITKLLVSPDDTVQVGQALAEMAPGRREAHRRRGGRPPRPRQPRRRRRRTTAATAGGPLPWRAGPPPTGVDLSAVHGSGPGGKVTKADVLAAANGGDGARRGAALGGCPGEAKPLRGPAANARPGDEREPLDADRDVVPNLRRRHARRQAQALNGALKERGMKVSFTHLIAWAIVRRRASGRSWPAPTSRTRGKPQVIEPGSVNLGIAVDVERKDGSRSLMVPCVKGADALDFARFHSYYEELITQDPREQAHRRRLPGHRTSR